MGWRDKYKGKRREQNPAMIEATRLKNSSVQFNHTNRNSTLVRADELEGVSVIHNKVTDGPQSTPTGRALFQLGPDSKRVVIDRVHFRGSGVDSLVRSADAEHLSVHGCSMEVVVHPSEKPRRTIFLPPSACFQKKQPQRIQHIGRNERCPCGSGKRFKHCHGELK